MIKAIIFDFAGVLTTRPCFPVVAERLSNKLRISTNEIKEALYKDEEEFMLGKQSAKEFWKEYLEKLNIPFEDFLQTLQTWYDFNHKVIDWIKTKKNSYKIFILSDNFAPVSSRIRTDSEIQGIFEEMYFSDETGHIKKEETSFTILLKEQGLKPSECVFIDDKKHNLVAPAKLGMKTILFKDTDYFIRKIGCVL